MGILPPTFPQPLPAAVSQISVAEEVTKEDIAAAKSELLKEYSDVFDEDGPLKTMKGPPARIELAGRKNATR